MKWCWKALVGCGMLIGGGLHGPQPLAAQGAAEAVTPAGATASARTAEAPWTVLPGGLRWVEAGPPEAAEAALECWVPAGSGVRGGQAAAATAMALLAALRARLPPPVRVDVELTTTHVRYDVWLPATAAADAAFQLLDVLTTCPVGDGGAVLPAPRWLHEAGIGPWLAAAPPGEPMDAVAFHRRHYRLDAMVLVVATQAAPGLVRETLADRLSSRLKAPVEAAKPPLASQGVPDAGASAAGRPVAAGRWAWLAVEGPPPEAYAAAAALAVAGEVLGGRLGGGLQRPCHVALEAAPGKTWLLVATPDPPDGFAARLDHELALLRDDTVDLAELEQARARVRGTLGGPTGDARARRRALGREAMLGLPGSTRQALAAVAQVGRAEVQAAAQRYGCGSTLRVRVPPP
ncbi:MAG: hypothetical protein VKQ33_07760 [Candidatus Sericytochromatia bacterium]|nr:hypothetical protein [Candidatus Sericytochromatia bacterium]